MFLRAGVEKRLPHLEVEAEVSHLQPTHNHISLFTFPPMLNAVDRFLTLFSSVRRRPDFQSPTQTFIRSFTQSFSYLFIHSVSRALTDALKHWRRWFLEETSEDLSQEKTGRVERHQSTGEGAVIRAGFTCLCGLLQRFVTPATKNKV